MSNGITSWSPSRWSEYRTCPASVKYKHIDGLPCGERHPSAEKGDRIHQEIQDYICGWRPSLETKIHPNVLEWIEWLKAEYKEGRVKTEQKIGINKDWKVTGYFAPDTWLRTKIDASHVQPSKLIIFDWKTGKYKKSRDYDDALEIYGLSGLVLYPEIDEVRSFLMFTGTGEIDESLVLKEEFDPSINKWNDNTHNLFTDTLWPTNPGQHCRWCPFSKNVGGPCAY